MNRFNLLTYTAAVALAVSACASTISPRAPGAERQQSLLVSSAIVEETVPRSVKTKRTGFFGHDETAPGGQSLAL